MERGQVVAYIFLGRSSRIEWRNWRGIGRTRCVARRGRAYRHVHALSVHLHYASCPKGTAGKPAEYGDDKPAETWRAVFVKYPDRFLVGTDTWVTSRWEAIRDYHRDVQVWLGQLPRDVAEAIAWKNGDRLFPAP